MDDYTLVDGEIFLGRVDEQRRFRDMLNDILKHHLLLPFRSISKADWSYVVLLYGTAGMGKTMLSKRFRDVAQGLPPDKRFRGRFQTIWLDWETPPDARLLARTSISFETVLDHLYATFRDAGFGDYFKEFERERSRRGEVQTRVNQALASASEEGDLYGPLRKAGSQGLAFLLRSLPAVGTVLPQDKTAEVFEGLIQGGAQDLAALRPQVEDWLRRRLKPEEYRLFVLPHEVLASAFAKGIRTASADKPIIFFLDTYEIVYHVDQWLRLIIKQTGPRVVWVLASRDDLTRSRRRGQDYLTGYQAEFPSERLRSFPLSEFSTADIARYFLEKARDRPLDSDMLSAIQHLTYGIPLAVQLAANIWARGASLQDLAAIDPEQADRKIIIRTMTERFLIHAERDPEHRQDVLRLSALALAYKPDYEILSALWDVKEVKPILDDLEQRYDFVFARNMRLHDAIRDFLREYMLVEVERRSIAIQEANMRVIGLLDQRLIQHHSTFSTLAERLEDEHWVDDTLALIWHRFWFNEDAGWKTLLAVFPAGLVYDRNFARALLEVATFFSPTWTQADTRHLKTLKTELSQPIVTPAMFAVLKRPNRIPISNQGLSNQRQPDEGCANEQQALLAFLRGQEAFSHAQYEQALTEWEQAARWAPKEAHPLRQLLGFALVKLTKAFVALQSSISLVLFELALRAAKLAVEMEPDNSSVWGNLGNIFRRQHRLKEAYDACQHAITLDAKIASTWHELGHIHRELDQYDDAVAAFKQAVALDPKDSRNWRCLADLYVEHDHTTEALQAYQQAVTLEHGNVEAWHGMSALYEEQGSIGEAISALRHAAEIDTSGDHWYVLATLFREHGRNNEAIDALKQAIALNPNNPDAWHELGHIYEEQDQMVEAINALNQAVNLNHTNPWPWHDLGHLYEKQGQLDEAISALKQACKYDYKNVDHWKCLGIMYETQGNIAEAQDSYQKVVNIDPTDVAIWYRLAHTYEGLGQEQNAIDAYRQAIAIDPHCIPCWAALGRFLYLCRNLAAALDAFQHAVNLLPQNAKLLNNLGFLHLIQSNGSDAVASLTKAIEFAKPDDYEPFLNLAIFKYQQRQPSDGQKLFGAAMMHCIDDDIDGDVIRTWLGLILGDSNISTVNFQTLLREQQPSRLVLLSLLDQTTALSSTLEPPLDLTEIRHLLEEAVQNSEL